MSLTEISQIKRLHLSVLSDVEIKSFLMQVKTEIDNIRARAKKRNLVITNKGKIIGDHDLDYEKTIKGKLLAILQSESGMRSSMARIKNKMESKLSEKSNFSRDALLKAMEEIIPDTIVEVILRAREIKKKWVADGVKETGVSEYSYTHDRPLKAI